MKTLTMARAVAPVLLCLAGAAQATGGAQDDSLRVVGRAPSEEAWRAAVTRDLAENLVAPRPGIAAAPEGIVEVSFRADANGRATDIAVLRSSDMPALDRAALFAVSRLRTLRRAPVSVDTTRPIAAWIYFANTDGVADKLEAAIRRETMSMAANGPAPFMLRAG